MDIRLVAFYAFIFVMTLVGFALGFLLKYWLNTRAKNNLEERLSRMRVETQDEIAQQKKQANKEVTQIVERAHKEAEELRAETSARQKQMQEREEKVELRQDRIDRAEERHALKEASLEQKEAQLDSELARATEMLETRAGLSEAQAREQLLGQLELEHAEMLESRMHNLEQESEEKITNQAKGIVAQAIQRYGNAVDNDILASYVTLADEDAKGKIIGKEGRNIKAFEQATGVQLLVDETPNQVTISSFDPIRRAVAKTALEELLLDGRIQPARIEEVVEQVREGINETIVTRGRDAMRECGVRGFAPELVHILGRLYYRYSFGQNVLQHSIEMAHIARVIATELGADVEVAVTGALVHDIGKAVDHEVEGTHVEIGRRILQKYGIDNEVVLAMQAHHEEYPYETIESRIVQTADAISSARPGARSDNAEVYIQKLQELERIANSIEGVSDAYAVSAGREVRIFVDPSVVNDFQAGKIARQIAKQVQEEVKYPGEIKVIVIREKRSIEIAR